MAATGAGWLVALCVLAGAGVGGLLARGLADGGYRIDEEVDTPLPPRPWTVTVAVAAVWGLLAWRLGGLGSGAVLPAYLLLGASGVALHRIDRDVHRLPEGLTFPTAAAVAALLVLASALTGDWGAAQRALVGGVAAYGVYFVLALLSRGQFGLGDVTLGGIVGMALAYLDSRAPLWGLLLAFASSGVYSLVGLALRRLTLRSNIAFGPFILAGGLVAALLTG